MDLSKLPRLSETDKQTPPPVAPIEEQLSQPAPVPVYEPRRSPGTSAEIWLSVILGIVFMLMGQNFGRYLAIRLSGQPYHTQVTWTTGEHAGEEVGYFQLEGYTGYTEAAIFLFGLAMVLEGAVLAFAARRTRGSRILVGTALLLTVGVTVFNIIVAGLLFKIGITPIVSILIIAFGGWMAMFEWQLFRDMSNSVRA